MVILKKRPRTLETPKQPQSTISDVVSNYEQCREKRIKENMERMQKLGLFDLSSKLKSENISPNRVHGKPYQRRTTPQPSLVQSSTLPPRRSSRIQNATPVSYAEEAKPGKEKGRVKVEFGELVGEGWMPEVYTEEHEKLLGSCESSWTLFVDGYGKDGRRIYDPVKGKSCHQCRQKTLGYRTHCSKCDRCSGQFCGDCLYMRYGEHVLEANKNPDWICPVCRGICNCSLCRQAKGWPATGQLYRKISSLGYKSVAHYLIQTRRGETKSDDDDVTDDPVSVKRSLPFADAEDVPKHDLDNIVEDEIRDQE
ncbi:hypothetical protein ACHQM5_016789 [Ranunculus cassubicifolius]